MTSLHFACRDGYIEIVSLLIQSGCDINVQNRDGITPLNTACLNRHVKIVSLLLQKGCDINIKDNKGLTVIDTILNQDIIKLIKTKQKQIFLLKRKSESHSKLTNRLFSIITRYTQLIDITYLISIQRK